MSQLRLAPDERVKAMFRATASRGIAALTTSSTLSMRATRARTRHWTGCRVVCKQACPRPGTGQRRDWQETMMEIIITDLTRFSRPDIVCTAGINPATNECIRPLPYLPTNECRRLNILPGAILEGNFTERPSDPPHTEDKNYQGKLSFKGPCSADEFRAILKATESLNTEEGFSVNLSGGEKHIPSTTPPDDGRNGYWLQLNGIYTFPEYLSELRCHK
jgi:hypothetical protein